MRWLSLYNCAWGGDLTPIYEGSSLWGADLKTGETFKSSWRHNKSKELRMRTLVERMLPPQFLLDLGTYMQTAAHIELAVWQTTMHAEGIDPHSAQEYRSYVDLKLKTSELLSRFRRSANDCPTAIADRIHAVAQDVANGIETRNLVAHGAFFWEGQSQGTLGAAHYFARGNGKERELYEANETVGRLVVEETIQVADKLLRDVIALRGDVIQWRYPDGMPKPLNLPPDTEANN
ncbi:MAG: hypothetical protein V4712_12095 [Pseudomonadota bacterium]